MQSLHVVLNHEDDVLLSFELRLGLVVQRGVPGLIQAGDSSEIVMLCSTTEIVHARSGLMKESSLLLVRSLTTDTSALASAEPLARHVACAPAACSAAMQHDRLLNDEIWTEWML